MNKRLSTKTDIVERLRALSQNNAHSWDAIVRDRNALRDEIERLRAALGRLLATIPPGNVDEHAPGCGCVIHEARAALAASGGEK